MVYNKIMNIQVTVKLHSKQAPKIVEISPGELIVHINAKPHDGEANQELIKLLAKHFRVPKTQIQIVSGAKSRKKSIVL